MLCNFKKTQLSIAAFVLMAGLLWCAEGTADDETFNYTGAQQSWVVPAGVTSVIINATGARGGGLGAKATGTYTVTPGETLYIYVGGKGVGLSGGYNGGGNGGGGYTGDGTGGGGASDVRQGGTALANRIIVGGGGGGISGDGAAGGAGGTPDGSASGGGGGTTSGGGAGQAGDCGSGVTGVLGIGGAGGGGYCADYGGGGGGGGYYGGGGGGDGFSGGGGGGGGSSNVLAGTSTSYTAGAGSDHGQVVITYTPAGGSGPLKGAVMLVE